MKKPHFACTATVAKAMLHMSPNAAILGDPERIDFIDACLPSEGLDVSPDRATRTRPTSRGITSIREWLRRADMDRSDRESPSKMPGSLLQLGAADPGGKRHVEGSVADAQPRVHEGASDQRVKRRGRVFPKARGFQPAGVAEDVHGVIS